MLIITSCQSFLLLWYIYTCIISSLLYINKLYLAIYKTYYSVNVTACMYFSIYPLAHLHSTVRYSHSTILSKDINSDVIGRDYGPVDYVLEWHHAQTTLVPSTTLLWVGKWVWLLDNQDNVTNTENLVFNNFRVMQFDYMYIAVIKPIETYIIILERPSQLNVYSIV